MEINEKYIAEILELTEKFQHGYYPIIRFHKKYLYEYINNWCAGHDIRLFAEKVYWTINKITEFPKCENPNCKNNITSKQFEHLKNGYRRHCSKKCANDNPLSKQRVREYNMKKYGYENTAQVPYIKKKMEETNKRLYGASNVFSSEYGKNKIKKYWNDNFGVDNPLQLQRIKDLQASHREASKIKEYETKRKNHTFNTSKPEEKVYKLLCQKFGVENIKRQYRDKLRYPFCCDFYITSRDIFLEYNGNWTHGKHRFNPNDDNDVKLLNEWKQMDKKYYHVAVHVWSESDVEKYKTAEMNKLNYVAVYNMTEFNNWLSKVR